ncbi:hypothetical protein EVAR_50949_1 [Eumeta japonica]|uniref:Uncharacterized protein n=1 Tax=Eumeta variegata TaxID=151549 RepID=A0A4C1XEG8_EUMVA|nr:hypothetical protein EVAR_50949_1 [Eumeta japonica]
MSLHVLWLYYRERSEQVSNLISATDFRLRSSRRKYHQHPLDGCHSTTVLFMRIFLLHAVAVWNDLPSAMSSTTFEKSVFKKRAYYYLKGRQRTSA